MFSSEPFNVTSVSGPGGGSFLTTDGGVVLTTDGGTPLTPHISDGNPFSDSSEAESFVKNPWQKDQLPP